MGIKQIFVTCVAIAMILVGVPLLVLPGPGLLLIAAGIGILVSQFRRSRRETPQLKGKSGADSDQLTGAS